MQFNWKRSSHLHMHGMGWDGMGWIGLDWIALDAGSRGNESIFFVNNVMLQCSGKKKLFPHGLVVYKKRVLQEFVPRAVAIKSNHFNLSLFWKALGFVATKFPSRYH